ncbi:MAG: RIP metalloprotease RseP [Opitutaceae bacterium]
MIPSLLHHITENLWTVFLIVLFFGGSIFVHELGHFVTARRCGLKVDRFSVGVGPAIWSWRGRSGVEYRISWLPFGGYVLLPQLADLSAIEGRSESDASKLPVPRYRHKMVVFVAGAVCNVLFALALACAITVLGERQYLGMETTRIGDVSPTVEMPNGTQVPSPALVDGLKAGDRIVSIDGKRVRNWDDVRSAIILGSGRTSAGRPKVVFTVERDGRTLTIPVLPRLSGEDGVRQVGISEWGKSLVAAVDPGTPAAKAGLKVGDQIVEAGGIPIYSIEALGDQLTDQASKPVALEVLRGGSRIRLELPPRPSADLSSLGADVEPEFVIVHPSPFTQVWQVIVSTVQQLASLVNPHSNIGLSKMSGPIGIIDMFHQATEVGIRAVLGFTILINVSLAIINLLPIPVLDGGQMLFATIEWLRGRRLPIRFVLATQSVFLVLIVIFFGYVSFFDIGRWRRSDLEDRPAPTPAPAAQHPASAKP